jgi:hypothetical protein
VEQIEQLEIRIEELREAIERSRRLMLARTSVRGPRTDIACLLHARSHELHSGPDDRRIALAIGGVVLMGSSRASTEQLMLSLKRTEGERSVAIKALELVPLPDRAN